MAALNPVAFELGPLAVRWYGILIAAAILIGLWLALKESKRQNVKSDLILDVVLWSLPVALIGARLFFVIANWDYYQANLIRIFYITEGGLAIHGGIMGAYIPTLIVCRRYEENFWKVLDLVAPSLILGQAIGRIGNYINQEVYGHPTDLPWAVYMHGAYRHPTFFYESIWNVLVFAFLIWYRRKNKYFGQVFWAYVGFYSIGRFIIEYFRVDAIPFGILSFAQWRGLVLLLIAIYFHQKSSKLKHEI